MQTDKFMSDAMKQLTEDRNQILVGTAVNTRGQG